MQPTSLGQAILKHWSLKQRYALLQSHARRWVAYAFKNHNLQTETKDLHIENYKTRMNDKNRWRNRQCSWNGRTNIVKMNTLPKAIYRFNVIPIKLLAVFVRYRNNLTICMEIQKTSNSQSNLEKEEWNCRNKPA